MKIMHLRKYSIFYFIFYIFKLENSIKKETLQKLFLL